MSRGISVGDRVLAHEAPLPGGSGFRAEQVLVTTAHTAPVPSELEPVAAAALPVNGLTAWQALEALGLTPGQRLLITNGGGSTGALAIQPAAAAGVEVTATASPAAAERLRAFGAAEVIDYHDPAWPDLAQAGFDAALIAAPRTAGIALPLVGDGRQVCLLTSDAPDPERGITSTNLYVRPDAVQLTQLTTDLVQGLLRLAPEPLPLTDGPGAYDRVTAGRTAGRKLVLVP